MKHKYLLSLITILLLSGFTASSQELLLNGNFESWDDATTPTSWSKAEATNQDAVEFQAGSNSAKITATATRDIAQTISSGITPGDKYLITIWYKVSAGDNTDARIWSYWRTSGGSNIDNNDFDSEDAIRGPNNSYFDNNSGEWTKYQVVVTAPATAAQFYFEVRTYNGATVNWDSFSFFHLSTWDGSTDNDWDTASNWTPETIPGASSKVFIPSGLTNYPTASGSVTVDEVNMQNSSSLIAQDAFTGTVTYNRSLGSTNWYLVSSPVSGEIMTDMRANNSFNTNGSNEISFAPYDNSQAVASDRWAYFGDTATDALVDGKGYSTSLSANGDIIFSGTINTSDVAIALTQGGGSGTNFNLLGNPFTAYINSGTFLTNETGDLNSETIWLWDQSGNGGAGEYVTKVTADAFKVAPGQGFFVEASSTNNVTFTEAMQSHEGSDTFQRNGRAEVHLFMKDGTNDKFAKLYYIDGTTTSFDNGYDGELFSGVDNPFAIYTHLLSDSQGKNYQIQSLPNSNYENMIVPVGVNAVSGKELTFSVNAMNLPDGIKVYLEDKSNNSFTRLDETNAEYKITLDTDLNGIGRFYLHTTSSVLNTPNFDISALNIYKTTNTNLRITGLQSGNASTNVYNILGKRVFSNSFKAKSVNDINLPELKTGVYIIQLTTEQGKINKKIIIE